MSLIAVAQSHKDLFGFVLGRFADKHRLETPFERRILLNILAVFGDCRRAYNLKLSLGEHWFEYIRRVCSSLSGACADQRVNFIYKENHVAVLYYLVDYGLYSLLEFAPVLGTGNHSCKTEIYYPLVFKRFRNLSLGNFQRETLGNCCLADARLAYKTGIVLGPAGKNLYYSVDFLLSADDRIYLAVFCFLGEIAPVFFQTLAFAAAGGLSAHSEWISAHSE